MIRLTPLLLLVGCAQKPEVTGSWVSVTKPPIQIVYMNRDEVITPDVVYEMMDRAARFPYKDYQFNSVTGVSVDATSHQSSSTVNSTEIKGE